MCYGKEVEYLLWKLVDYRLTYLLFFIDYPACASIRRPHGALEYLCTYDRLLTPYMSERGRIFICVP